MPRPSPLLLFVVLLAACSGDRAREDQQAGNQQDGSRHAAGVIARDTSLHPPTLEELRGATFDGLANVAGPVTLRGGRWEGEPFVAGGAARPTAWLVRDFVLQGDLDGRDDGDAAVLIGTGGAGSGSLLHLAAVGRRDGRLVQLGIQFLGDRVQVRAGSIVGRGIRLYLVRAGADDAMCCPGEMVTLAYTLDGDGGLDVREASRPTRLSLAALGEGTWELTRWAGDEPARHDVGITLAHDGGRLIGSDGCNRYFVSAEDGDRPGDLILGPIATTKKGCPPPVMDVARRFAAQLGSVVKYGFLAGRLALTYEREGHTDTMLFRRVES